MTSARDLAFACDQYVSAMWRGETPETAQFSRWLRNHWTLGPSEPSESPAAVSSVGAAGAGIRWHQVGRVIYGYIPGVEHRCYQIPVEAALPPVDITVAGRVA